MDYKWNGTGIKQSHYVILIEPNEWTEETFEIICNVAKDAGFRIKDSFEEFSSFGFNTVDGKDLKTMLFGFDSGDDEMLNVYTNVQESDIEEQNFETLTLEEFLWKFTFKQIDDVDEIDFLD